MDRRYLVGAVLLSLTCSGGGSAPPGTKGGSGGSGAAGGAGPGGAGPGGTGGTAGNAGAGGSAGAGGAGGSAGRDAASGGGAGGSGGAGGAGGGTPAPATGASVLERNKNPTRDGHFIDARMTKASAARMALDANFKATFTGAMWASPLYLENGPGGKGVFFAVTTGNDVFALEETTGATVWMRNVGQPAGNNGSGCGDVRPIGILGTPVIDAQSRTMFLSAAVGNAGAILRHEVHAISVDDGMERPGWPVDVSKAGNFDPKPQNPRSALSLVKGIVYVAYGGHVGDCGGYHGRVVAIDSKDPTKVAVWSTLGVGEAIWASGGMASDGDGVFATTGNRTQGGGGHQDSEEVVHIRGMAGLARGADDIFFPAAWQQMDGGDADFGSSSPVVIQVPGATPSSMLVATAKTGHMYFLDTKKLGGMGGQLVDFNPGRSGFTAPTSYATGKGTFVALTLDGPTCPMATPGGQRAIVGVFVAPGAPVKPEVSWCAPMAGERTSPIATTTDGKSEAMVWYTSAGKLRAVDGETGMTVFDGGAGVCAGIRKWTSPIVAKGRVIAGGDGHLCAWSPGP